MAKLSVRDIEVTGKRVLVRVDFNVPVDERDGNFPPGAYKKVFMIDISDATDVGPAGAVPRILVVAPPPITTLPEHWAMDAPDASVRDDAFRVYMELASFTGAYLAHQDFEERDVMPALERAIGPDAVFALNQTIVASIPPDEMAKSLALMIPAMNVDDRAELLGGMQQGAPAEVFNGVWGLVKSVLVPADASALGRRLGIG